MKRPLTQAVWRFRLAATCALLTALAFLQDPGRTAADTKLDLTVDPWGFLGRATHLWDEQGFFGQLQNQAYGYFFPMGPWFGVLRSAGIEPWVVQRLWWALLLGAAFLGTVRLCRLLGIDRPEARWVAGLAYALAPRVVTTIGPISSETLVVAVAPWLLVPLVLATQGHAGWTPRRGGLVAGVALLLAGGVNAVATAAALVLPALWLLTREPGAARRRIVGWWVLGVGLASLWWAVPLLTLGRFSPPFLDWIESASVTTGRSDAATALRGTEHWVAHVSGTGGPAWPAGWQLVTTPVLILLAGLVATVGLVGLAVVRRERGFLLAGLLTGLVLITLGHTGPVSGLGSEQIQDLLDGVLAPLRNTHKFDLVMRLPLAVGVGVAVSAALAARERAAGPGARDLLLRAAPAVAAMLVLLAAWPALAGGLTRDRAFVSIPGYWRETAEWLGRESGGGRALVVPGAPFGTYLWGRSQDEPLQPLASSPWGVRDAVPLSSAGNIRLLDAVEQRLATGRGSAGLAEALSRAGVRFLVVRNDLDTVASQAPRSILVHEALDSSPGISFAAAFGPPIVPFGTERLVVDARLDAAYPAVEVYRVDVPGEPPAGAAVLRDATQAVWAPTAAAEAVLDLADAGLLRGRPALIGVEQPEGVTAREVLTDSYRRSELDFGRVSDNRSATLTADEAYQRDRRANDYPAGPSSAAATVRLEGVRSITASSSQAGVGTGYGSVPGASPAAAADGSLSTAWQVRDLEAGAPSWWQVELDAPRDVQGLQVAVLADPITGQRPDEITVVTDAGTSTTPVDPTGALQEVAVAAGTTGTVRIELPAVPLEDGSRVTGLAEVVVPGVLVGRPLVLPASGASGGIVLTARGGGRDGCAVVPLRFPCAAALPRPGEDDVAIDRVVDLPEGATYDVRVVVRQRPSATAGRLLDPLRPAVRAAATSVLVEDPRNRAQAAVDRDPSTSWIAGVGDTRPALTLTLPEPRRVTGLVLQTEPDVAASRPFLITVSVGGRTIDTALDEQGAVQLPPATTDTVTVTFRGASPLSSLDLARGITTQLPVGVSEVFVRGALDLGQGVSRTSPTGVACGFGPVVEVDGGAAVQTRLGTTVGTLLTGRPASTTSCSGPLRLEAGEHRIRVRSTPELEVRQVVLVPAGSTKGAAEVVVPQANVWEPTRRVLAVERSEGPRLIELGENANRGWTAQLGGQPLEAVVVDGWRQGFLVPAGASGEAVLEFGPDRVYRAGLAAGAAAALLLVVLAALPSRRRTPVVAAPARAPRRLLGATTGAWGVGAVCLLVGALPGAAAGAAGALLARRGRRARVLTVAVASVLAAAVAAAVPWPGSVDVPAAGAVASLLALVAFAAASWPDAGASAADEVPQP